MPATEEQLSTARILVVDDEEANVRLLERILERAGYRHVRSTTKPHAVLGLVEAFRPDLLLLDLRMPGVDGFDILRMLPSVDPGVPDLPVLVLTADLGQDVKRRALAGGARDFRKSVV